MRPKEVGLIGFEHVTASHLTGPADAFTAAILEDGFGGRLPCYKVRMISLTNQAFAAESGLKFQPETALASAPPLDTIIVAGGDRLRLLEICDQLAEWILRRAYETRRIASICNGIYALAPTGLLDGREVTTHWRCARDLARRYPTLRVDHRRRLVKDGSFYTSAGLTAGIDLALALIEEDYGKQVALSTGRELMMYLAPLNQPNEPAHEYASQPIDRFGELVGWIMRNLDRNLTVETLARQACMCPNHFTRAFKSVFGATPGDFVDNLRLNEARRRLSSRRKTVRGVAVSVGFRDAAAFRRAFARRFGTDPGSYLSGGNPMPIVSQPKSVGSGAIPSQPSFR
ncbi:MAG: GlxA family transcriptional regulator [Chthoniobacterales bacterium]